MSERRGADRHGGMLTVRIEAAEKAGSAADDGTEAEIVNLSSGGACLRQARNLNVGNEVVLRIPTADEPIAVPARVIWVNLDGFHGLQFLSPDDETLVKIAAVASRVKDSR